jgi:hypothetical protein
LCLPAIVHRVFHRVLVPVLVPVLVALTPVAGFAQTPAATALPGPPSWLRPGVVLTYRAGQGSSSADGTSASGAGLNQIAVLHVDQQHVLAIAEVFATSPDTSGLTSLVAATVRIPAAESEYWMHPSILAVFARAKDQAVGVRRRKYTIGAVTYDALTLSRTTVRKDSDKTVTALSDVTYDLRSGLMIASELNSVTRLKTYEIESTLGYSLLAGVRVRKLPWTGAQGTTWNPPFRTLEVGTRTVVSSPGIGDMVGSTTFVVSVAQSGSDYVVYEFKEKSLRAGAGDSTTSSAGGPATLDLFWMPPDVLSGLRTGQQIDLDPTTKRRVYVASARADSVTITIEDSAQRIDVTYNATTGISMNTVIAKQSSVATTTTEMTVVGRS